MGDALAGTLGEALVLTCNINGGLLPGRGELDGAGKGGSKLMYLLSLLRPTSSGGGRRADVVCIQEPGLAGQVPPASVSTVMGVDRLLLHSGPAGMSSKCGVAMAIHSDWSVLRIMRDDRSCRAIGALLERSCDASRLLVINLYLPSNLDRLGCGSAEAAEAAELCELARTWVRKHAREAHGNVVVCGDLNQTLLPVTLSDGSRVWERTLAGKGVARDAACAGILEEHLLSVRAGETSLIDLFRSLHPLAGAADSHTRSGASGFGYSTSRIDYVLVAAAQSTSTPGDAPAPRPSHHCWVESSGEATDHATVWARIPLQLEAGRAPPGSASSPRPSEPKPPFVGGLSAGQRRACAVAIERAVAGELACWEGSLSEGGVCPSSVLSSVQEALVATLLRAVRHILPRGPPRPKRFMSARVMALSRAARSIRAVRAEVVVCPLVGPAGRIAAGREWCVSSIGPASPPPWPALVWLPGTHGLGTLPPNALCTLATLSDAKPP